MDPQKAIVINQSERAVSTDITRLQQFQAAFLAEVWRAMIDTSSGTDDLDAAGLYTPNTTTAAPDSAIVFSGLLVQPAIGSFAIGVTAGALGMLDPDATPDPSDSPYKVIEDPGVASGVLNETANTSGSTRIDLIIATRTTTVLETDSRDIFNNVTGLFTPSTVTKVQQQGLAYSIVSGTPGSGMPAIPTGCVVLMVASVPNGSTSNDTCTFWDVRPMFEDRLFSGFNVGSDYPRWHHCNYRVDTSSASGKALLVGTVDVSGSDQLTPSAGHRRLGGRLRTSGVSADLPGGIDGLDLNDSNNWASAPGTNLGYVYLLEGLAGLPRWARYTNVAAGVRKPRSPRGFLVVSTTPPTHFYGTPSAAVGVPTSTGLGAITTKQGICIAAVKYSSSAIARESICDGRGQWGDWYPTVSGTGTTLSSTAFSVAFNPLELTQYPPGAKAVEVDVVVPLIAPSGGAPVSVNVVLNDPDNNAIGVLWSGAFFAAEVSSNNPSFGVRLKLPVPALYPSVGLWPGWYVVVNFSAPVNIGLVSSPTGTLQVVGWDWF